MASDELYENPKSLESKKIQAFNSARACADMSKSMKDKMFKCKDVQLMGKLNDALCCIWELMWEYRNKVSFSRMGSLLLQQNKYWPILLDSRNVEMYCVSMPLQKTFQICTRAYVLPILHPGSCKMLYGQMLASRKFHLLHVHRKNLRICDAAHGTIKSDGLLFYCMYMKTK